MERLYRNWGGTQDNGSQLVVTTTRTTNIFHVYLRCDATSVDHINGLIPLSMDHDPFRANATSWRVRYSCDSIAKRTKARVFVSFGSDSEGCPHNWTPEMRVAIVAHGYRERKSAHM